MSGTTEKPEGRRSSTARISSRAARTGVERPGHSRVPYCRSYGPYCSLSENAARGLMTMLACLVLLAASSRVELVDEVFQIPANEWRYVELGLRQRPAAVDADYEVRSGPPRGADGAGARSGARTDAPRPGARRHGHDAPWPLRKYPSTPFGGRTSTPSWWTIAIAARPPACICASGSISRARGGPEVTTLPLRRQFVVILVSFAVFFAIVTWSANRLLRVIRR